MLRTLLLLTFCMVLQTIAYAQEVKIGTFLIPQYVQNEKSGEFIKLALIIAKKHNLQLDIEVLPAKRIQKYVDLYDPTQN